MKTTKLLLVIAFLVTASFSYSHEQPRPFAIKVSLRQACEQRGLVQAIQQQVNPRTFLQNDIHGYYVATVHHKCTIYVIYGKYEEWVDFLLKDDPQPINDIDTDVLKL